MYDINPFARAPQRPPTGIAVNLIDTQRICDLAHAKYEREMDTDAIGFLIKAEWGFIKKGNRYWVLDSRGIGSEVTVYDPQQVPIYQDFGDHNRWKMEWEGRVIEIEGALVSIEPICTVFLNVDLLEKTRTGKAKPLERFIETTGPLMKHEMNFWLWTKRLELAVANEVFYM